MTLSARIWDRMYRHTPSWDLGAVDPVLSAVLDAHRTAAGRAIDLGCGTGDNAIELARRGWHVVGVDVSDRALERARSKASALGVSVEFVTADIADLPPYNMFDLVIDRGLLMSLAGERARRRYVRTIEARCAPGGRIYSAQWVLAGVPRRDLIARALSRARTAVLSPGEMDERFGSRFAIEILNSEITSVDDPWLRRLGLRRVKNVSYWLRRSDDEDRDQTSV